MDSFQETLIQERKSFITDPVSETRGMQMGVRGIRGGANLDERQLLADAQLFGNTTLCVFVSSFERG